MKPSLDDVAWGIQVDRQLYWLLEALAQGKDTEAMHALWALMGYAESRPWTTDD